MAMGGADLAYTRGVNAIHWNPAGMGVLDRAASVQFSTMSIFNDVSVNYLAMGFQAGKFGVLGLAVKALNFGDIPLTTVQDMDGLSGQTFSPTFATFGFTFARAFTNAINFGVNAKLIYESIPRASASAFAVDIGVQYRTNIPGLGIGLVVKNLGTDMKYDGSAFLDQSADIDGQFTDFRDRPVLGSQLPASMLIGVSYKRPLGEINSLIFSGNFQHFNLANDNYQFGAEYGYKDLVFVRGGYMVTPDVDSEANLYGLTAGIGGHITLSNLDIVIDYAYRDVQYWDGESLFTIGIGF
jgi:hypothetical protein